MSADLDLQGVPRGQGDGSKPHASSASDAERAGLYVPRILQQHLFDDPSSRHWIAEGGAALVDISGFTKLSERLARKGREGAEQIAEAIGLGGNRNCVSRSTAIKRAIGSLTKEH